MKKTLLSLATLLVAMAAQAQSGGTIMQPTEITGRRIDASGEVTREYAASYTYTPDGKLEAFHLPEYNLFTICSYENDFIIRIGTHHSYGTYSKDYTYYDDGKLKMIWTMDEEDFETFTTYSYRADGRLSRMEYFIYSDPAYQPDDYYAYSAFEYGDGGKTRVESYYEYVLENGWWVWGISRLTTRQYDDNYALVSEQTVSYNNNGEVTGTKRVLYTYTPNGDIETVVKQTLAGEEWVNNSIHIYVYGDDGRIAEQRDGGWSEELGDWDINKKTVHELSSDGAVYTVSFYKKSGDEWVWDVFSMQTVFLEPELKNQAGVLGPFRYEPGFGSANINQFEFTMVATERPTYMSVNENAPDCKVYPNPGNGLVRIEAPAEDCVVRFYDLQGRLVTAKPFDFNTSVATDGWSQGVYLWEIWIGTQRQASGKWVKE